MGEIDVTTLRKMIDDAITQWVAGASPTDSPDTAIVDKLERTDNKRAIRTKSTGDRVYIIDDSAKTKAWVTSPEVLTKLGFTMEDVEDLEDNQLVGYQMAPSIYRVDE